MIIHNPILTGSFTVNGTDVASITSSAASITAINAYTASQNILNGTYTLTSSFAAQTASFTAFTSSVNTFTASQLVLNGTYATTGSNTFAGIQTVNSNLVVTGSITAQTLVVQTITSSVDFVTGSTRFGSIAANTHQFTGSVGVEGTGIFYQPLTNSTSYLTVKNNRARNAAVYTETTNGGFYAGTSIGTDTFNYQIYDGVAGSARLTISSTGAATFSSSITAGGRYFATTSVNDNILEVINTDTTNGYGLFVRGGGTASNRYVARFKNAADSDVMWVGNTGNVGIGTIDPQTILSGFSSSARGMAISNGYPFIALNDTDGGNFYLGTQANLAYVWNAGTDAMIFGTSNTERMRITSVGNLEMRPIVFSGVANNATQTVLSNMGKGTWLVSVANDVDSSDGYSAMLWVRTNEIIQMQVFRVDSMVFSYSNQDLRIQNTSGFSATLYVTAIRMAAS